MALLGHNGVKAKLHHHTLAFCRYFHCNVFVYISICTIWLFNLLWCWFLLKFLIKIRLLSKEKKINILCACLLIGVVSCFYITTRNLYFLSYCWLAWFHVSTLQPETFFATLLLIWDVITIWQPSTWCPSPQAAVGIMISRVYVGNTQNIDGHSFAAVMV